MLGVIRIPGVKLVHAVTEAESFRDCEVLDVHLLAALEVACFMHHRRHRVNLLTHCLVLVLHAKLILFSLLHRHKHAAL